ncbi:MAG TPA: DUF1028 domain-containing protein [Polyangiaceae bacterium]
MREALSCWPAPCLLAAALGVSVLALPWRAQATYSIVAMERATGRAGAASASCVPLSTLQRVYAFVPEHGAVLTQSYLVDGDASQALALELLGQGARADAVIAAMTDPQFDPEFALRQYVVLDANGGVSGFTGLDAEPFAAHRDASDAWFSAGIAGNFLTGASVLEEAALGFRDDAACDLEERLVNALVAASTGDLGDARCVVDGRPAQASWLHVAGSNGAADLDIAVDAAPGIDPVAGILSQFSDWRSSHPCPEPPDAPPSPNAGSDSGSGCAVASAGARNALTALSAWPAAWLLVWFARRRAHAGRLGGPSCALHSAPAGGGESFRRHR